MISLLLFLLMDTLHNHRVAVRPHGWRRRLASLGYLP